ncbi:unnamed protein product [Rotaria sp. Silwood2]|nr:unnamed protein product [Rotaria sp. Silwood2]
MQIENLPDELFVYIFWFIRPKDLFQGWYNLNYHINSILRSIPISIEIKKNDDFNDCLPSLQHFYSQIAYLKDERYFPKPEIDVRQLTNIRSLYLNQCSNEQYKHIHPNNQPHLTRFFSLSVPWSFYEQILFGQTRFSHLTSIGFVRGASILLMKLPYSINTTIRHLHLHSATYEIISKFLQYLPYIISLTIDYLYTNSSSSIIPITNSYIRHLTLIHSLSSQSHFEELLVFLGNSNLTEVRVTFDTCEFDKLACILTKLSCMEKFNLKVKTYPSDLDLTIIRLMSPWFLTLNYAYVIEQYELKRILLIKTTRKQLDYQATLIKSLNM